MRAWVRIGKRNRLRYVSHLDMQRLMQRALNRTTLPFAWSQGFNPHPVMSFASAMAMGWTSEYEIVDIRMAQDVTAEQVTKEMAGALPPDMPVYEARLVDDRKGAPMALVESAEYRILFESPDPEAVFRAIQGYMGEEHVIALRKTKTGEKEADIRPMTYALNRQEDGSNAVIARLALTEKATLKPDLLMQVLASRAGTQAEGIRVHRLCLLGAGGVPLMEL